MVLGNRVKGHLFQGNRGTISASFEGNRQTKKILGNMEHRGNNFAIFGNWGTRKFISWDHVPPCEGLDG